METFTCGKYLGQNSEQVKLSGLLVTKSSYKEAFSSDWHKHENIYMTFILKGGSKEKRIKREIECMPGMLLLYSKQETHKNLNYKNNSKNLHIEFDDSWFKKFDIDTSNFEGQSLIKSPLVKCELLKTISEINTPDSQTEINLEATMLAAIYALPVAKHFRNKPEWVKKLYELLHDEIERDWTLHDLSQKINVHPVTISKYFPNYFKVNIGDYIRMIKIEKSLPLLSKMSIPIEEVALKSCFVDNAHYTRVFKKHTGITPSYYRTFVGS
jgi:AraC family transcriptional regulator